MAFYGRVTNESKTSMTFDKVYPNVATMKANVNDGVFTGRFVLVEYDTDLELDTATQAYISQVCGSSAANDYVDYCNFVSTASEEDRITVNHEYNYKVDKLLNSKLGRGYDSTVWRKISKGGSSEYVMLAELNSVVPTFNVEAAPPTDPEDPLGQPIKPYFSKDSTNVMYNLHVGVPWGLEIPTPKYNKIGFNDRVRQNELPEIGEDRISVTDIESGEKYQDKNNPLLYEEQIDTKKIEIALPSLGRIARDSYDLMYGKGAPSTENNGQNIRDVDNIGWSMADQAKHSEEGLMSKNHDIKSIAGAINSVCDLVGTNIIERKPSSANSAKNGYIYYDPYAKKYYFKDYTYTIDPLDPTDPDDASLIHDGSGYVEFQGKILNPNERSALTNKITPLYVPTPAPAPAEGHENDPVWEPEDYTLLKDNTKTEPDEWYCTLNSAALEILTNPANAIQHADEDFATAKAAGTLWKIVPNGSSEQEVVLMQLEEDDTQDSDIAYYRISNIDDEQEHKVFLPTGGTQAPFYTYDGERLSVSDLNTAQSVYQMISEKQQSHPIDEHGDEIPGQIKYTTILEKVGVTYATQNPGSERVFYPWPNNSNAFTISTIGSGQNAKRVVTLGNGGPYEWQVRTIIDSETNAEKTVYVLSKASYTATSVLDCLRGVHVCTISLARSINPYRPNAEYWGSFVAGEHIYRKTTERNDSVDTYKLPATYNENASGEKRIRIDNVPLLENDPVYGTVYKIAGVNGLSRENTGLFYFVSNELFLEDNGTYIRAEEYPVSEDANAPAPVWYKYREVVVKSDPLGEFHEGELWNTKLNLAEINARSDRQGANKLVLGIRVAEPTLFELDGYGEDQNTLNGWLVYLNKLVGSISDPNSRNAHTIQGLMNTITDKLDRIESTAANKIIATDHSGHLVGAEVNADDWTTLSVSTSTQSNVTTVSISHKANSWASTNTASNAFGVQTINGNTVFVFPTVDSTGHINGSTQVAASQAAGAVQMPNAFTTVVATAVSASTNNLSGESQSISMTPGSINDTITLSNWNKWVIVQGDSTHNVVRFAHAVGTIDSTTTATTVSGDTIDLQTVSYDEAGHIIGNTITTYTLPAGFKTINGITASNTGDALTINTDSWLSTSTSTNNNTNIVTIAHANPLSVTHTSITDVNLKFGDSFAITDLDFDGKGHFAGSGTHSITLPTVTVTTAAPTESGSSIVRGISFDSSTSTATLTQTVTDVDRLVLANYVNVITPSTPLTNEQIVLLQSPIAKTDPIHQAFEKLQYQSSITASNITSLQNTAALVGTNTNTDGDMTLYGIKAYVDRGLGTVQTESDGQTITTTITLSNLMSYISSLEARITALETASELNGGE